MIIGRENCLAGPAWHYGYQTVCRERVGKIEEWLSELGKWMSLNKLKLNKDKTELLYLYSKHNPQQSLPPIRFGQDIIQPSQSARNIGAIFDSTMTIFPHISSISATYHLRNISRIRKFLSKLLSSWSMLLCLLNSTTATLFCTMYRSVL